MKRAKDTASKQRVTIQGFVSEYYNQRVADRQSCEYDRKALKVYVIQKCEQAGLASKADGLSTRHKRWLHGTGSRLDFSDRSSSRLSHKLTVSKHAMHCSLRLLEQETRQSKIEPF